MMLTESNFPVQSGLIIPALFSHAGKTGTARQKYSLNPSADAAIGAENPTIKDTQPLKNPDRGL